MTVVTTQPAQLATQTPLSFRKNVAVLRADQLAAFRLAVAASMAVSDDRGWQHWAGLHGLPLPMYCQHHTPLFLPWHRAYLYYLELTLREHEITATLPWWDWSAPLSHTEGLPAAYTADTGADGAPNPLAGADINDLAQQQGGPDIPAHTSRQPDALNRLPTPANVQQLLAFGDFFDFQQQLEQVHDNMHVWVGGTMQEIPLAAYDPSSSPITR